MNQPVTVRGVTTYWHPWSVPQDFPTREAAVAFIREEVERGRKLHCAWVVENGLEVETFMIDHQKMRSVTPPRLRA